MFRNPVVVGGGTSFLPPVIEDIALDLSETRTSGSRVIYERYARAGRATSPRSVGRVAAVHVGPCLPRRHPLRCAVAQMPASGGAAGSRTVTQSPPAARGVRVRVPSCAWVMLLTIARPRPTPAWPVRMRLLPR